VNELVRADVDDHRRSEQRATKRMSTGNRDQMRPGAQGKMQHLGKQEDPVFSETTL
jgi:hypothetical protein